MSDFFDIWKLLAGLALFLFGMHLLETALKKLAGKKFRRFIRYSTNKPVRSVIGGIFATTIVQSSSLVGLIVLAFVGAGIIPLVNAIGIIIGSNLGTTFTGWIVTTLGFKLNFTLLIYPMLAIGGLSYGLLKGQIRNYSLFILGFALLLMGLDFMKDSVGVLTTRADIDVISGYPLIVYLLVGTLFTAIIQSSSAAMMLTLSALYAGIIPLPAAAALVIGADLGTTSTVLLGSLQGGVSKRRLAMAHVLFNVFVDTLAFLFLFWLLDIILWMNLTDPLYSLVAFHSIFNFLGLALFLPFIGLFAKKLEQWIPEDNKGINLYIHDVPEYVADAAVEALSRETRHLLYLVIHLNLRFLTAKSKDFTALEEKFDLPESLASAGKLEEYMAIKGLEGELINYALKVKITDVDQSASQSESLAHQIDSLINAARYGVYSAKSFKDIEQDFSSFHMIDNKDFSRYFHQLKKSAISNNLSIASLINDSPERLLLKEQLTILEEQSHRHHTDIAKSIYEKKKEIHLSPIELSTLLNVNNEIQASANALIKSLRLI